MNIAELRTEEPNYFFIILYTDSIAALRGEVDIELVDGEVLISATCKVTSSMMPAQRVVGLPTYIEATGCQHVTLMVRSSDGIDLAYRHVAQPTPDVCEALMSLARYNLKALPVPKITSHLDLPLFAWH